MTYIINPSQLSIPLVVAPMFLVSSAELVIEACSNGVMAAYPLANSRSIKCADELLGRIKSTLDLRLDQGIKVGAWIVNMVVHSSYQRFNEECTLIEKYQPPIVISALGSPRRIVDLVHSYGGLVWADVSSIKFAKKAIDDGVDGLILLCAGAGGHTGHLSAFAFLRVVRQFFDKTIILSGSIMDGTSIYAAQILGADLVYMGTRFIATHESIAKEEHKKLLLASGTDDIITTKAVTGVAANFILSSLEANNIDPNQVITTDLDFTKRYQASDDPTDKTQKSNLKSSNAWKDIYSAGHGVGLIKDIPKVKDYLARLQQEYLLAKKNSNY